jgi:hypothetical protein
MNWHLIITVIVVIIILMSLILYYRSIDRTVFKIVKVTNINGSVVYQIKKRTHLFFWNYLQDNIYIRDEIINLYIVFNTLEQANEYIQRLKPVPKKKKEIVQTITKKQLLKWYTE